MHDDGAPFIGIGHNRCWSLEQLGWSLEEGYSLLTDMAASIADWTGQLRSSRDKPVIIGEFGTSSQTLQPDHIHNGTWAGLASGGARTPLDWNDGGSWGEMTPEMFASMAVLSQFTEATPFGHTTLASAAVNVSGCDAWIDKRKHGLRMEDQENEKRFGKITSGGGFTAVAHPAGNCPRGNGNIFIRLFNAE